MASNVNGVERRRKSLTSVSRPNSIGAPPRPRTVTPSRQPDRFERKRSGSVPLDRVSMLIMEANEISQCLGKDYYFSKNDEAQDDDKIVMVVNRRYSISTTWSLGKLKERLNKMRKLVYAGDAAGSGYSTESVFYDTKDDWKKEVVSSMFIDMSPDVANGTDAIEAAMEELKQRPVSRQRAPELPKRPQAAKRQTSTQSTTSTASFNGSSTGSSTGPELPAESEFMPAYSHTGPAKNTDTVLPHRYLVSGSSRESRANKSVKSSRPLSSSNSSTPQGSPTHNPKASLNSTSSHGYGVPSAAKKLQLAPKRRVKDVSVQTENSSGHDQKRVLMLTLCKEMITMTLDRMRRQEESPQHEETMVDRILVSCESVKVAVINILEAYTQAQETGQSGPVFADSDLVRVTSMHLVAALELLVSQTAIWTAVYAEDTHAASLGDISMCVHDAVRQLASEILTFIQSCEQSTDSEAHESSTSILELLYTVVKHCGQLSLATDTCPVLALRDHSTEPLDDLTSMTSSSTREDDLIHIQPGSDLKQAFLSGADVYLDQSLEGSMGVVESCEVKAEKLTPDDVGASKDEASSEILKHVYIAVATSKLLVLKSQQIQVELDTELKEDSSRSEHYYLRYYWRCQGLLTHINRLADSISMLVQAAHPLANDGDTDPGSLLKVCRCSEMIQRNSRRLVTASSGDADNKDKPPLDGSINASMLSLNGLSFDLQSVTSFSSDSAMILTSKQLKELNSTGEDVILATKALVELCRKELVQFEGQEIKVKRMLPVTPSSVRPTVRCRSARSADRRRLGRNLSELDVSRDVIP